MRSFLIRDILSGSSANQQAAAAAAAASTNPAAMAAAAAAAASRDPMASSSGAFDYSSVTAQSLAATQALFLAKWAEHQQQLQANKYFAQLQQQQQQQSNHHLNLTHTNHRDNQEDNNNNNSNRRHREDEDDEDEDEDEDDEDEDEEDQEEEAHAQGAVSADDEDEEEIEVEKLTATSCDGQATTSSGHLGRNSNSQTPSSTAAAHNNNHLNLNQHHHQQQQKQTQLLDERQQMQAQSQLNSPLDALFQMTSSTFDALKRGEKRKAPNESTATGFTAKQNPKKKRKSRTAFTNSQIYELERRFRMQKYLSPTDRDEIALTLNLSNAQVITWFQNRRAKMKRDLEEQRRDIETASLLNLQKTFFESFQALSQMKTTIGTKD